MSSVTGRAIGLYLCIGLSLAFLDHRVRREQHRAHVVSEYNPSVIAGTSGAPAKYRVLMPFTLDYVSRHTGADPYSVFLLSELLFIVASLIVTHFYLRQWFTAPTAVAGTLAVASFLPLTFTNSWAHPDTFPDLLFFTGGCLAVAARRDALLVAILLAGLFNRETIVFVALLWGLERLPEWRRRTTLVPAAAIFGITIAVYVGLRLVRGFEHYDMWMVEKNWSSLRVLPPGFDPYTRLFGFFWIFLVAIPFWVAWSGARRPGVPAFFLNGVIVAGLFSIIAWLFAAIVETRVFVPVLPLLLPAAVAGFTCPSNRT
jgi:hypothetical protein